VFVPGPGDVGPGLVLPRPPLPDYFTADLRETLPTATFATNPCRLRYSTREMVFFRDDIEQRMRRMSLIPPPGHLLTAHPPASLL
jgi:DNA polymerase epsilon subunit 2